MDPLRWDLHRSNSFTDTILGFLFWGAHSDVQNIGYRIFSQVRVSSTPELQSDQLVADSPIPLPGLYFLNICHICLRSNSHNKLLIFCITHSSSVFLAEPWLIQFSRHGPYVSPQFFWEPSTVGLGPLKSCLSALSRWALSVLCNIYLKRSLYAQSITHEIWEEFCF